MVSQGDDNPIQSWRGGSREFLRSKGYIPGIIHRVTLFIGLRGPLAADQTARMLHVLLAALLVWLAAGFVATTPLAQVSFPRIFNTAFLAGSCVTALVLLWLGHFRGASLAYLAGIWIWATLVCFSFGGVHSPGALLYVSLPASAAWLLGYDAAITTAGVCLVSALVFTVLEMTHVSLPLQAQATVLGIWTLIVQSVLVNAIPVGQIIGRLREALWRNCRRQLQQHLESLVDQRTQELVQARDQAESANHAKSAFLANMSSRTAYALSVILVFPPLNFLARVIQPPISVKTSLSSDRPQRRAPSSD